MRSIAVTLTMPLCTARKLSFEECYQSHREDIYRLGLRFGGGRAAFAEDLTHDVFLRALEHLADLAEIDNIGGWLYRVAANLAISRLGREQSVFRRLRRDAFGQVPEAGESPEVSFEHREEAKAAMALLRSLPTRERVVVSMKLLDGKSQREIAEALSMSEGYVSKLLARARRRIEGAASEAADV